MQARLFAQSIKPSEARELGTIALVRAIYGQLRKRHAAPGLKWYLANMCVQVSQSPR